MMDAFYICSNPLHQKKMSQRAGSENVHTPPQRKLKFRGGGGFCKTKTFKEICEALSEFPEGWREGS